MSGSNGNNNKSLHDLKSLGDLSKTHTLKTRLEFLEKWIKDHSEATKVQALTAQSMLDTLLIILNNQAILRKDLDELKALIAMNNDVLPS